MTNKNRMGKSPEGLCSTCNNAPDCTLCTNMPNPVWDCGEYEDTAPSAPKNSFIIPTVSQDTVFLSAQGAEEAKKFRGLCLNCENRTTCAHEKAAGGIWHCEDYQ